MTKANIRRRISLDKSHKSAVNRPFKAMKTSSREICQLNYVYKTAIASFVFPLCKLSAQRCRDTPVKRQAARLEQDGRGHS